MVPQTEGTALLPQLHKNGSGISIFDPDPEPGAFTLTDLKRASPLPEGPKEKVTLENLMRVVMLSTRHNNDNARIDRDLYCDLMHMSTFIYEDNGSRKHQTAEMIEGEFTAKRLHTDEHAAALYLAADHIERVLGTSRLRFQDTYDVKLITERMKAKADKIAARNHQGMRARNLGAVYNFQVIEDRELQSLDEMFKPSSDERYVPGKGDTKEVKSYAPQFTHAKNMIQKIESTLIRGEVNGVQIDRNLYFQLSRIYTSATVNANDNPEQGIRTRHRIVMDEIASEFKRQALTKKQTQTLEMFAKDYRDDVRSAGYTQRAAMLSDVDELEQYIAAKKQPTFVQRSKRFFGNIFSEVKNIGSQLYELARS